MSETLLVPGRFCGPARSGNGGYVGGALAQELGETLGRAVTVTLRQPPPLDASMHVVHHDDGVRLTFGGAEVAEAGFVERDVEPVEEVAWEEAAAAEAAYVGLRRHPFPQCFVCGTARDDGLRIFPGEVAPAVAGRCRVAATWTPDATLQADWHSYDDASARAGLAATWAALDCAGGWAGGLGEQMMVLASITAVVDDLPVVGEPHVVVGEHRGGEGRRTFTAATLHDGDGRIVGRAAHVWVAVDPATFS